MEPILQEPTIVLVKPVPYTDIRCGDIVVFTHRHRFVAHRAVEKRRGAWLTQGDRMPRRDSVKMTPLNYRGVVYLDNNGYETSDIKGKLFADNLEFSE